MDFFRGDALNLRNRIARVLGHWDGSVPGYSYLLGMHALSMHGANAAPDAPETRRDADVHRVGIGAHFKAAISARESAALSPVRVAACRFAGRHGSAP